MSNNDAFIELGDSKNRHNMANGQIDPTTHFESMDGTKNRALRSVPETDDDEVDDRPISTNPHRGVDDGLLSTDDTGIHNRNGGVPRSRRPSYAFPDSGRGYVEVDGVMQQVPDVNAYQHKKTLAQGMMDLALLSANANQLRYVLETYRRHPYYYPSLVFISLSIIFQVGVGVGLILNSKYNVNDQKEICRANKVNNYTVIGIFIITVVNVFISSFGVAEPVAGS